MKAKSLKGTARFLFIYGLIIFTFGLYKTEILISGLSHDALPIARMTSYLTMCISIASLFILLAATFGLVYYVLQLHPIHLEADDWIYCIRSFVLVMIGSELVKFAAIFIFLKDEIVLSPNLSEINLQETTFYNVSIFLDGLASIMGAFVFGIQLKSRTHCSPQIAFASSSYVILTIAVVYFIFSV